MMLSTTSETSAIEHEQALRQAVDQMDSLLSHSSCSAFSGEALERLNQALAAVCHSESWLKSRQAQQPGRSGHSPSGDSISPLRLKRLIEECLNRSDRLMEKLTTVRDRLLPQQGETAQRQAMCDAYQRTLRLP